MAETDIEIMHRVFRDILRLEDDSPLHKACTHEGVDGIISLLVFSPLEITDMTYLEGKNKVKIAKGHSGKVFALQALVLKREADQNRIHNNFLNVSVQEFDDFRISPEYISARAGLPNPIGS